MSMSRLGTRLGSQMAQYAVLTALAAGVFYVASGYISRHLAGSLIGFGTAVIGTAEPGGMESGGSSSTSDPVFSDTYAVGGERVWRGGGSNTTWFSGSNYTAAHPGFAQPTTD